MVRVYQVGKDWLIIRNLKIYSNIRGCNPSSSVVYDSWSGSQWGHLRGNAIRFPTREEAEQYLAENEAELNERSST